MFELNYDFGTCVKNSEKVAWRVDDVMPPDAKLDFTRPALPNDLTGVGQSFGAAVAAQVPALQPLIPNLDAGFHQAMSLSIADTFGIDIVTAGLAFVAALAMRELPLRSANTMPAAHEYEQLAGSATARQAGFRESAATE